MKKKKLVTMVAALTLAITSATMGVMPVNAAENNDVEAVDIVEKDVFLDSGMGLSEYDENVTNRNLQRQKQMIWIQRTMELRLMQA